MGAILLVSASTAWQNQSVSTSTKKNWPTAFDEDEGFRLADTLAEHTDEELARVAEEHAQADVSSSALEGIPLDKGRLEAGLLDSYKRVCDERAAKRQPGGTV